MAGITPGPTAGGRHCFTLPSSVPEYCLAARRPVLEVRVVNAFEPVANLHRCYLRRDPVFLRSLLRLVGRKVDRRFYFSRLLPGSQRGRAARRLPAHTPCCATASWERLLRAAAATGAEQRAASAAPADKRDCAVPGCAGLSMRSALPAVDLCHPPYIFPGRTMNYYGARRRGHDLAFHSELRDTLFASGLPFVLSINDVPEAWELYSRASTS